jgi:hypothetical protein
MPVSKKRKKDGKPVQRKEANATPEAHAHGPESAPAAAPPHHVGKATNPFVSQQQSRRGAQRGR